MSELGVTRSASFTSVTTTHTEDGSISSSGSRKGKWWKRYVKPINAPPNDNTRRFFSPSLSTSLIHTSSPQYKQIRTTKTHRMAAHLHSTQCRTLLPHCRLHLPCLGHFHRHRLPKHSLLQGRIRHGCS